MINPQQLLPIVKRSAPKANDQQILGALTKLAKAHPNLNDVQALALLQKYMQSKETGVQKYLRGGD